MSWGGSSSLDRACWQRRPTAMAAPRAVLFLPPPGNSSMNHLIDAVFNHPMNPSAILFLVEDTDFMACLQHSLRDSYLLMVLEAIYRNKPHTSVGSPTYYLPNAVLNSCTQVKAFCMSTSNLRPLEIPADPLIYHQLLQDYASLTNGHCKIAAPVCVSNAIGVN